MKIDGEEDEDYRDLHLDLGVPGFFLFAEGESGEMRVAREEESGRMQSVKGRPSGWVGLECFGKWRRGSGDPSSSPQFTTRGYYKAT